MNALELEIARSLELALLTVDAARLDVQRRRPHLGGGLDAIARHPELLDLVKQMAVTCLPSAAKTVRDMSALYLRTYQEESERIAPKPTPPVPVMVLRRPKITT